MTSNSVVQRTTSRPLFQALLGVGLMLGASSAMDAADLKGSPEADTVLERLRPQLAAGLRSKFPARTVERADSHYLLLNKLMTWTEAEQFAEQHGAHLAVLPTEADREWFRQQFPSKDATWLGGGKSAHEKWAWIDGSPWLDEITPRGDSKARRHLALGYRGDLVSAPHSQRYQPALQWHRDGSNPGTIEAQIERTEASAKAGDLARIIYPLGTRTYADSHFYYHHRSGTWNEARLFAAGLGAYLAAPSSSDEHKWISSTYGARLEQGQSLWLGGFRLQSYQPWQWLSRESWNNFGWKLENYRENADSCRLALQKPPGSKRAEWAALAKDDETAVGMLLEWSSPKIVPTTPAPDWQAWLRDANMTVAREVEVELAAHAKRNERLLKEYLSQMKKLARDKRGRHLPSSFDRSLAEAARDNRIVETLPEDASEALQAYHDSIREQSDRLQGQCERALRGPLTLYVRGVESKITALAEGGYLGIAAGLSRLIEPIHEDSFPAQLMADPKTKAAPWQRSGFLSRK